MELIEDLGVRLVKVVWIRYAIFKCSFCLQEVEKRIYDGLKAKSCGCGRNGETNTNYKHGETNTRLYHIWINIKQRCLNFRTPDYKDYGGRGITICPEWVNGYTKFRDWSLSNGYTENLTIDRIENDGNYEPNNCQWITNEENSKKKRNVKLTLKLANEIRELYKTGNYTQQDLATKYNTAQANISEIVLNKIWLNT